MSAEKKPGRPKRSDEAMGTVTFRLDSDERDMLGEIADAEPVGVVGRQSVVLRRLIREAHARLKLRKTT